MNLKIFTVFILNLATLGFFFAGLFSSKRIPCSVHLLKPNSIPSKQQFKLTFENPITSKFTEEIIEKKDIFGVSINSLTLSTNYHLWFSVGEKKMKRFLVYSENKEEAMELMKLLKL
jgi:hypothetical protein